MQNKKESIIEVIVNVFVGYILNLLIQITLFPFFDIHISISDNMLLTLLFTTISMIRSYLIRRFFNKRSNNGI